MRQQGSYLLPLLDFQHTLRKAKEGFCFLFLLCRSRRRDCVVTARLQLSKRPIRVRFLLLLIQPQTISGCALVTLKVPITSAGRDGGRGDEWRRRQAADSLRRPYLLQASFLIRLKVPCTSGAAGGRAGWCLCHCAPDSRFVLSL